MSDYIFFKSYHFTLITTNSLRNQLVIAWYKNIFSYDRTFLPAICISTFEVACHFNSGLFCNFKIKAGSRGHWLVPF